MKAIAISVAILTGNSNAALGGRKLARMTVATRSIVNVSGRKRERVWRMMAEICLDSCSFGMTSATVSVIIFRDDGGLRSRSSRYLPRRRRDRCVLGGRATAGLAPVDGEPAG